MRLNLDTLLRAYKRGDVQSHLVFNRAGKVHMLANGGVHTFTNRHWSIVKQEIGLSYGPA